MRKLLHFLVASILLVFACQRSLSSNRPQPLHPRVLMIVFNPVIESEDNRTLVEVLGWSDPDSLARVCIADLSEVSYGLVEYEITERIEVDEYPRKIDGFRYTDESFLASWRSQDGFHEPDNVDYHTILREFDIISKIEKGKIDEVWLFGFPYAGFYESIMAGKGAFYCNSDPLERTEQIARRFVIMGFNYERGVGEMLEDFGHRAESILARVWQEVPSGQNLWKRFTLYDKIAPGRANCGNVHFAPNSDQDYDWGNTKLVRTCCDDWYNFPDFKGTWKKQNCEAWGNGDIREHHKWWFCHFPHVSGRSHGISNNWWEFVIDPNRVR